MPIEVLISHAHDEKKLAQAWKDLLTTISAGTIDVWFSSDLSQGGGLGVGGQWRDQLYQQIAKSQFVLAIQTPASSGRPWIMWECGVASGVMRERGLIPIVYGMGKGDLASPLATYQVYSGQLREDVERVCGELGERAGIKLVPQFVNMAMDLYEKAIQLHPPAHIPNAAEAALWRNRFEQLVQFGRSNEVQTLRQSMYQTLGSHYTPTDASLHDLVSRILLEQKRFVECIEETDYGLRLNPNDVPLLHRKALALVHTRDFPRAQAIITQLYERAPALRTNPEIASLEGRIRRTVWELDKQPNDLQAAFDAYYRAYDADRSQYFPGINAAELALFKNDRATADPLYREIIATCTDLQKPPTASYWIDFTLGQAYLGSGDAVAAKTAYERGLNRNPRPDQRDRESAAGGARRTATARGLSAAELDPILDLLA